MAKKLGLFYMYDIQDVLFFEYDFKKEICTINLKDKRKFNYRMTYEKFKETYHNYIKKIYF